MSSTLIYSNARNLTIANMHLSSHCRINNADVQVTQGISQSTSSTVVSLVDDMLQSQRMTIEDLLDASEVIKFKSNHVLVN